MRAWLAYLVLLLAVVVTYGRTLDAPFIWDDRHLILDAPPSAQDERLVQRFRQPFWIDDGSGDARAYYRPLTMLSFALDRSPKTNSLPGNELGNVYYRAGLFEHALRVYRVTAKTVTDDPFVLANSANALSQMGHYGDALALFERLCAERVDVASHCLKAALVEASELRFDPVLNSTDALTRAEARFRVSLLAGRRPETLEAAERLLHEPLAAGALRREAAEYYIRLGAPAALERVARTAEAADIFAAPELRALPRCDSRKPTDCSKPGHI